MSAAINPKGAHVYTEATGPKAWAGAYVSSSVGQKVIVAVTGLGLVGFLIGHMIGNLKIFSGPESLNKYAYFLQHDIGALLWIARAGLLFLFFTHLTVTLKLQSQAKAARPIAYHSRKTAQASTASKTMLWTGLVVGAFTLFHLAHYTFTVVHPEYAGLKYTLQDGKVVHDVYSMMIMGFTTPWISIIYVAAQLLLFFHLSHGIASALRTLGLVGKRFEPAATMMAYGIAGTILLGNVAIVLAVQTGLVLPVVSIPQ
jgi:succinate dehydrogenase / fumarate reductase, cytochrome b subunit